VFFKLLKIVGVIFQMAADGANGQVPHQEAIRNHERKYEKTQSVEPLEDQGYRKDDKQDHQVVEESAGGLVLSPPVIGFYAADDHGELQGNLGSLAPEGFQVMNARHLVGTVV